MKLYKWSYRDGYLLCYAIDANAEGVALFKRGAHGNFRLIRGVGGEFDAKYLVSLGVPEETAKALVRGLHK